MRNTYFSIFKPLANNCNFHVCMCICFLYFVSNTFKFSSSLHQTNKVIRIKLLLLSLHIRERKRVSERKRKQELWKWDKDSNRLKTSVEPIETLIQYKSYFRLTVLEHLKFSLCLENRLNVNQFSFQVFHFNE